ncbi:MAG: carboxymuconolactone decarboxylase family protein [Acidobacteriota bacterium]
MPDEELSRLTRERKKAHARLLAMGSPVYKAFLDMEKAAYSDGALPKQVKELIAVGISVVIDCRSCMQWHIEQAAAAGAGPRQVLEAVEVGIEMGGGPATVSARFALDVMADVFGPEALRSGPSSGPGGGPNSNTDAGR